MITLLNITGVAGAIMPNKSIIVALDFDNKKEALSLVDKLDPTLCRVKIGKEMFTLFGPDLIADIHQRQFDIFLDLKFHDIPTTVAKAITATAKLGVWMTNVHAAGGMAMMHAAKQALLPFGNNAPLLIAVTVLTSMNDSQLQDIGVSHSVANQVVALAKLAQEAQLDGVVCSAQEAHLLKETCGKEFMLITPGIRPIGSHNSDQQRVMTPKEALAAGSDYLVIGRPITQAKDPMQALQLIHNSLK